MDEKNPHAVALGRLSAQSRTPEELSESNRRAARARWGESAADAYMERALGLIASGVWAVDPVGGRILQVSSRGRACTPTPIGFKMNNGYKAVGVRLAGERHSQPVLVHRLIWSALFGPIPDGLQINHKNGRKGDNWPENLEVVTQAENNRHAQEVLGKVNTRETSVRGEAQHLAKLTEKAVAEIRARYVLGGISQRALAAQYGVTQGAIFHVLKGDAWNGGKPNTYVFNENGKHAPKVGPPEVREIRRRHAAGEDFGALAAEFGCSRNNAYYIVTRRTWKNVD